MAEAASPVLSFLFFQNSITTFVFARRFYNLFSHRETRKSEKKRDILDFLDYGDVIPRKKKHLLHVGVHFAARGPDYLRRVILFSFIS